VDAQWGMLSDCWMVHAAQVVHGYMHTSEGLACPLVTDNVEQLHGWDGCITIRTLLLILM
jgi:hypothetical protein